MYINSISHYLPEQIIRNDYFNKLNSLSDEWIESRTGIKERRKASETENTNTMAIKAVENAIKQLPYSINDVELIIGATYTPHDTIATIAHTVQNKFNISDTKAICISSACSSFINAVEIAEGYFATNKARKALIVTSEHNTAYSSETDLQSGHLWGDGAAAIFISKNRISNNDYEIIDVDTNGLGNIGKAIEGVTLQPVNGGIKMPFGKDVFINANKYMASSIKILLKKNLLSINNIDYVIPHQANIRIIENVRKQLNISREKVIVNIDKLGNTGCASTPIALSQNKKIFIKGDMIAITVFGGGYSSGAMLIKI